MNLVEFFSFFLVIVIIAASPIPQNSSSSRVQHIDYHSSELDSTLLRRAPQEAFELTETFDQDSNPQETGSSQNSNNYLQEVDSSQNSNNYLQEVDSAQTSNYHLQETDSTPNPDYDLQGYTVAENVQSKPRPREGDTQQSSPEPSDDSNIPLIPTRRFNPKKAGDYTVDLEHNPGGQQHQEEEGADLYDQLYARMDGKQKALMQQLKSIPHVSKAQVFNAAKSAAVGIGGAGLVAWLVANWNVIAIGLGIVAL